MRSKRMIIGCLAGLAAACAVAAAVLLPPFETATAKQEYFDLTVRSSLGLDSDDVRAVRKLSDISYAEGLCRRDTTVTVNGKQQRVTAASLPTRMSNLSLTGGRMPEQAGEVVAADTFAHEKGWALGQSLILPETDFLKTDAVLVGIVEDRWSQSQIYLPQDNFVDKTYDILFVYAKGTANAAFQSPEYTQAVETAAAALESIRENRQQARYELFRGALDRQIEEEENLSHVKLDPGREVLDSAKEELDQAAAELADAKKELENGRYLLNTTNKQLSDAKKQIADSEQQLAEAEGQLQELKTQLNAAPGQLAAAEQELNSARQQYQAGLAAAGVTEGNLESSLAEAESQLGALLETEATVQDAMAQAHAAQNELESTISQTAAKLDELRNTCPQGNTLYEILADEIRLQTEIITLTKQLEYMDTLREPAAQAVQQAEQANAQVQAGKSQLQEAISGLEQLISAKHQIEAGEAELSAAQAQFRTLEDTYESGAAQYQDGAVQLDAAKDQYNDGLGQYQAKLGEFQKAEKEYKEKEAAYQDALKEYEEKQSQWEQEEQKDSRRIQALKDQRDSLTLPQWIVEKRTHE